jgi:hypothetical protein
MLGASLAFSDSQQLFKSERPWGPLIFSKWNDHRTCWLTKHSIYKHRVNKHSVCIPSFSEATPLLCLMSIFENITSWILFSVLLVSGRRLNLFHFTWTWPDPNMGVRVI